MMDILNILLWGWMSFGAAVFIAWILLKGNYLNSKSVNTIKINNSGGNSNIDKDKNKEIPKPKEAKIFTNAQKQNRFEIPAASGSDPDAVKWLNNVLVWSFKSHDGVSTFKDSLIRSLNDYTCTSALQTGVLVEIVEILKSSCAPSQSNVIIECLPSDDMIITFDLEALLHLHVQTIRSRKEVTFESDYACAVNITQAKVEVTFTTHLNIAFFKYVEWPEIFIEVEGIGNNSSGIDEHQLQEVLKEELNSAVMNIDFELTLSSKKTFPKFFRAKNLPDRVIPVGYDSLIREKQTHPPSFLPPIPESRRSDRASPTSTEYDAYEDVINNYKSSRPESFSDRDEEKFENNYIDKFFSAEAESLNTAICDRVNLENINTNAAIKLQKHKLEKNEDLNYRPQFHSTNFENQLNKKTQSREQTEKRTNENPITNNIHSNQPPLEAQDSSLPNSSSDEDDYHIEFLRSELGCGSLNASSENRSNKSFKSIDNANVTPKNYFDNLSPICIQPMPFQSMYQNFHESENLTVKRLLVKVVRADNVGNLKGTPSPYTVIEMDEPAQRFSTVISEKTNSPFWDEQFLFDLNENTLELLFEIYDGESSETILKAPSKETDNKESVPVPHRFLGLGIVGIEELIATPSQRQIIPLQGRPGESDSATGTLTCEFLFLDRADLPDFALRRVRGTTANLDNETFGTPTPISTPAEEAELNFDSDRVHYENIPFSQTNEAELRPEVERKDSEIENISRLEPQGDRKKQMKKILQPGLLQTEDYRRGENRSINNINNNYHKKELAKYDATENTILTNNSEKPNCQEERGRSRNRGFFTTLKRKFSRSRSKLRSQSADVQVNHSNMNNGFNKVPTIRISHEASSAQTKRSASVERWSRWRSRGIFRSRTRESSPHRSETRHETRSFNSSSDASKTSREMSPDLTESLIIFEKIENGILRHYEVPYDLSKTKKWHRKGTKLHIFNDHSFIAKRVHGCCEVCGKILSMGFGKKQYECRECNLKCHKICHVNTKSKCVKSKIQNYNITYVAQ